MQIFMKKIFIVMFAAILLLGAGCAAREPKPSISEEKNNIITADGVLEITVKASEFAFDPYIIGLKKGERVRLILKNTGKYPHDWIIEGLDIRTKTIAGGESDTIEFTADKIGEFPIYCGVGNHREKGMEGKIFVEE